MEIEGIVLSKIYEGVNGYTVIEVDGEEPTIVVGTMPGIKTGEHSRFFGDFKNHHKYGKQFVATSYQTTLPKSLGDITTFLGGGFIKGLGERLAERLVEEFGEEIFHVIEEDFQRLSTVRGISKKLALTIHSSFLEYSKQKYLYADLIGLGLSATQAGACVEKFGDTALYSIKQNPYILTEINGMDFKKADAIALKTGVALDDPNRIRMAVFNVLNKNLYNGNTHIQLFRVITQLSKIITVKEEAIKIVVLQMALRKEIFIKRYREIGKVIFNSFVYKTEQAIALKLFLLSKRKQSADANIIKNSNIELTEEQETAVVTALTSNVCVITGGPGTGKTTILNVILSSFYAQGKNCALAAPTGRAAKRMQETCNSPALTIHRLLEYSHDENDFNVVFKRNDKNPLEYDVVIIDEVSMLDIFLFNNLLKAMDTHTTLVLVGDENQLNSVGPGNVMSDLITSNAIKTIKLTHKFRNAGDIADSAYAVLKGNMPVFDDKNVVFYEKNTKEGVISAICDLYKIHLEDDVQILCPLRNPPKSGDGVTSLWINNAIREKINPQTPFKNQIIYGDTIFREGDRVMQIKNNYGRKYTNLEELTEDEGVFNGDLGVITSIQAGNVYVQFEDMKECVYNIAELNELESAFCYTIHKSQGSEFNMVILGLLFEPNPFFARNLLYTAITRAKTKVFIVGSKNCLEYMINNADPKKRTSILYRELAFNKRFY